MSVKCLSVWYAFKLLLMQKICFKSCDQTCKVSHCKSCLNMSLFYCYIYATDKGWPTRLLMAHSDEGTFPSSRDRIWLHSFVNWWLVFFGVFFCGCWKLHRRTRESISANDYSFFFLLALSRILCGVNLQFRFPRYFCRKLWFVYEFVMTFRLFLTCH